MNGSSTLLCPAKTEVHFATPAQAQQVGGDVRVAVQEIAPQCHG